VDSTLSVVVNGRWDASIASLIGLLTVAAWMLGYDTPLTALDEGLGALGVSAAWAG
jgi:hypothetical protein